MKLSIEAFDYSKFGFGLVTMHCLTEYNTNTLIPIETCMGNLPRECHGIPLEIPWIYG